MAYSEQVLKNARERLEQKKKNHQRSIQNRRREVYEALPQVAQIDRTLKQTAAKVIAASLGSGGDPAKALQEIQRENQELQEQRRSLLAQRGYQAADIDDAPLCSLCSDNGWQGERMCACLKTLCTYEQNKALSDLLNIGDQSFETFQMSFYDEAVDPRYGISPRQNMERIGKLCQNYAKNFGRGSLKNLFFYGGTGLGKTFLSACIAKAVSESGHSVVYDTAGNIFAQFEEQKFSRDADDVQEAKQSTRKYLKCDLLIVDDLGSELTTPFVRAALYELINSRLTEKRCTIISSNYTMDEQRQRYTHQIASRLEGEYEPLPFFGRDIRLVKKER